MITARIDHARATIRARGRLDRTGADLLRGTVETLHRDGHHTITLDLGDLSGPEQETDAVLDGMIDELSAAGARIVVRRKPSWESGGQEPPTPTGRATA